MRFSIEIGSWTITAIVVWILCRDRLRLSLSLSVLALFLAAPLIWVSFDPEGSEAKAEFLSYDYLGFFFGTIGGLITGSSIAAVCCLPKDRNRRLAIGVFILLGFFVAMAERKSEIFTTFEPSGENKWEDGVCIQTSNYTCGPASLATCLKTLGVQAKEEDLAVEANTSKAGTLLAYLARVARHHGLKATFHAHQNASDAPLPAVASVTLPSGIDHCVAVIVRDGQRFIADPLDGLHSMESVTDYRWSGMFLSLSAAENNIQTPPEEHSP